MSDKDRLDEVLAVAVNPGAYEQEAVAALHKARELVKRDPNLAFDLPSMSCRLPWLAGSQNALSSSAGHRHAVRLFNTRRRGVSLGERRLE
jgi:hypothetical protein